MRRSVCTHLLALAIGGVLACLVTAPRPDRRPADRPPDPGTVTRVTVGHPDPSSPSGRAFRTLRVTAPRSARDPLTDEWVVTLLSEDGTGEVRSAVYVAR